MKMLSVVVLNLNGQRFLKDLFNSIKNQTSKNFEVIMIDNGSTDNSVEFVENKFPWVKIIKNSKNLGIAEASNIGYRTASGKYIVAVSNDMVLDKHCFERLLNSIENSPKDVMCVEGAVHHFEGGKVINGSLNIICDNTLDVFDNLIEKFYAGGGFYIIKNRIFKNYYDPDYFFYGEDTYLGWMLRIKGYNIIREPQAKAMHYGSATINTFKERAFFLSERNKMMNFLLFYETKNILKILPLFLGFNFVWSLAMLKKPKKAIYKWYSFLWVLIHIGMVLKKRKYVQSQRRVGDDKILPMISSRIMPRYHKSSRLINNFVTGYCRLLGLNTYEISKSKR